MTKQIILLLLIICISKTSYSQQKSNSTVAANEATPITYRNQNSIAVMDSLSIQRSKNYSKLPATNDPKKMGDSLYNEAIKSGAIYLMPKNKN